MRHRIHPILAKTAFSGLMALSSITAAQAADVGVAINVAVPGVYGQISIGGGVPTPELILPRPTVAVVAPGPVVEPLYLHVPPGHEHHWREHCREYNACNRPVYFVSDHWYHNVYTPYHVSHHVEEERELDRRREEERRLEHHEERRIEEHRAEERHIEEHRGEEHREHDHDNDHDHDHDHDHGHDRDHDRDR